MHFDVGGRGAHEIDREGRLKWMDFCFITLVLREKL